jgi:site-specific recombinase XerD
MICLLWRGGLRLGEALALCLKDVDLDRGIVVVQRGKGGKRRVVGLDPGACALVERWLRVRSEHVVGRSAPMICTLDGKPLDQSYVRHLLPRLARRVGIDKRVHAHAFRHAFAVELEREGARLTQIRDLLGHSSAAVADQYLRRIGASDATDFVRNREWAAPA